MLKSLSRASMLAVGTSIGLRLAANRVISASASATSVLGRKGRSGLPSNRFTVPEGSESRDLSAIDSKLVCTAAGPSSVVEPMSTGEEDVEVQLLPAIADDHGGVIVEMKNQMEARDFISSLRLSIFNWRQQGKRGVWIKLPIELANLVHPAVEEGFWYHHAEANYLMLVYWIPATDHTLPVNATHRVGVGAVVLNDKREVLAVQEKSGKLAGTGIWKFPTGVVDQSEDIYAGAIREVKEETGSFRQGQNSAAMVQYRCNSERVVPFAVPWAIWLERNAVIFDGGASIDTEFIEVLAFRQSHKSFFEKSDLFFVCFLRPTSFDIQKQESEIAAAQWMPLEEFTAQPFVQKHELVQYMMKVTRTKLEYGYAGFTPIPIKSGFTDETSYFYLNSRDLNKS